MGLIPKGPPKLNDQTLPHHKKGQPIAESWRKVNPSRRMQSGKMKQIGDDRYVVEWVYDVGLHASIREIELIHETLASGDELDLTPHTMTLDSPVGSDVPVYRVTLIGGVPSYRDFVVDRTVTTLRFRSVFLYDDIGGNPVAGTGGQGSDGVGASGASGPNAGAGGWYTPGGSGGGGGSYVPTTRQLTMTGSQGFSFSPTTQDLSANRTFVLIAPQDLRSTASPTFDGATFNNDVTFNGVLSINSDVEMAVGTHLDVQGTALFYDDIDVLGDIGLDGALLFEDGATLRWELTRDVGNDLVLARYNAAGVFQQNTFAFDADSSLGLFGLTAVFSGDVSTAGQLEAENGLHVEGDVLFEAGNTFIDGDLEVTGDVLFGTAVFDNIDITGTLVVGGLTTLNGGADVTGDLDVTGDIGATGLLEGNALFIASTSILDGALTINSGGADITGAVAVTGALSSSALLSGATLSVTSTSTFGNTVTISAGGLGVTGDATFHDDAVFDESSQIRFNFGVEQWRVHPSTADLFVITKNGTSGSEFSVENLTGDVSNTTAYVRGKIIALRGDGLQADLNADLLDGYEADALAVRAENETIGGAWTFTNDILFSDTVRFEGGIPLVLAGGGARIIAPTGSWARGWRYFNAAESSVLGGFGMEGDDDVPDHLYFGISATPWNSNDSLNLFASGNLAFGSTADPSEKFRLTGTFHATAAATFGNTVEATGTIKSLANLEGENAILYDAGGNTTVAIESDTSTYGFLEWREGTGGAGRRWRMYRQNGANNNFTMSRYDSGGTFAGQVWAIDWSDGSHTFETTATFEAITYFEADTRFGGDAAPDTHYGARLGTDTLWWHSLFVGEIRAAILVAEEQIATVNETWFIGAGSMVLNDVGVGTTAFVVGHNNMQVGDYLVLKDLNDLGLGDVEIVKVTAGPTATTFNGEDAFDITVLRAQGGFSAKDWGENTAFQNTYGTAGKGFWEFYARQSYVSDTTSGPAGVAWQRTGTGALDLAVRFMAGNLSGNFVFSSSDPNPWGMAGGDQDTAWFSATPDGSRGASTGGIEFWWDTDLIAYLRAGTMKVGSLEVTASTTVFAGWIADANTITGGDLILDKDGLAYHDGDGGGAGFYGAGSLWGLDGSTTPTGIVAYLGDAAHPSHMRVFADGRVALGGPGRNLMDLYASTQWPVGSGAPDGWTVSGDGAYETLVLASGPNDRPVVAWEIVSGSGQANALQSNWAVQPHVDAVVRVVMAVRSDTASSDHRWYLGPESNTGDDTLSVDGTSSGAFQYFVTNWHPDEEGEWYWLVGYLYPQGTPTNGAHLNESGAYSARTGERVYEGKDLIAPATSTDAMARVLFRDNTSAPYAAGEVGYLLPPQVHVLDGTEPPLESIFGWGYTQLTSTLVNAPTIIAGSTYIGNLDAVSFGDRGIWFDANNFWHNDGFSVYTDANNLIDQTGSELVIKTADLVLEAGTGKEAMSLTNERIAFGDATTGVPGNQTGIWIGIDQVLGEEAFWLGNPNGDYLSWSDGVLDVVTTSFDLMAGTGSLGVDFTGIFIKSTGAVRFAGYDDDVLQVSIEGDGRLYAAGGSVILDEDGIFIEPGGVQTNPYDKPDDTKSIRFGLAPDGCAIGAVPTTGGGDPLRLLVDAADGLAVVGSSVSTHGTILYPDHIFTTGLIESDAGFKVNGSTGWTGTFKDQGGSTVTVEAGIITGVA